MTSNPQLSDFDIFLKQKRPEPSCGGLFYRCEITYYLGGDGSANFKTRFRPLKRMSCSGCGRCENLRDTLREEMGDQAWSNVIWDHAEHGKIYELKFVNISTDWETGFVDSYDLKFVEVKEEK